MFATIAHIGHAMQANYNGCNRLAAHTGADCGIGSSLGYGPRHAQAIDHPGLGSPVSLVSVCCRLLKCAIA